MLNVEVQLDVKMDPAIDDRRSLIGPLGSLLATLFAVAALHAEDASTNDLPCKAISPTGYGAILSEAVRRYSTTLHAVRLFA